MRLIGRPGNDFVANFPVGVEVDERQHALQFLAVPVDSLERSVRDADPLPAHAVGTPHPTDAFAEALDYITSHDGVWVTTGREIAEYYLEHCYDEAAAAIAAHKEKYPPS